MTSGPGLGRLYSRFPHGQSPWSYFFYAKCPSPIADMRYIVPEPVLKAFTHHGS